MTEHQITSSGPPGAGSLALPRYVSAAGVHPALASPDYRSTRLRAPGRPLVPLPQGLTEITGPLLGAERVTLADADLTAGHPGEPLGERIIVTGRLLDSDGRAVPDALIEVWQANASGRYAHRVDDHPAPLDPNFTGPAGALPTRSAATGSSPSSPAPIRGATTSMPGARLTFTSRCSAGHLPSG